MKISIAFLGHNIDICFLKLLKLNINNNQIFDVNFDNLNMVNQIFDLLLDINATLQRRSFSPGFQSSKNPLVKLRCKSIKFFSISLCDNRNDFVPKLALCAIKAFLPTQSSAL